MVGGGHRIASLLLQPTFSAPRPYPYLSAPPPLQRGRGLADRHDRSEWVVGDAEAPGQPSIISSRQICPLSPRPSLRPRPVHKLGHSMPTEEGGLARREGALMIHNGLAYLQDASALDRGAGEGLVAPWFWDLGHGSLGCRCAWW